MGGEGEGKREGRGRNAAVSCSTPRYGVYTYQMALYCEWRVLIVARRMSAKQL